ALVRGDRCCSPCLDECRVKPGGLFRSALVCQIQDAVRLDAVTNGDARLRLPPPAGKEMGEFALEPAARLDLDLFAGAVGALNVDARSLVVDERRPLRAVGGDGPFSRRRAPAALDNAQLAVRGPQRQDGRVIDLQ